MVGRAVIGYVCAQRTVTSNATEVVQSYRVRLVPEVSFLANRRLCHAVHLYHFARQRLVVVRVGIVDVLHRVLRQVLAIVVHLCGQQQLVLPSDVNQRQGVVPQHASETAQSALNLAERAQLVPLLELKVKRGAVRRHPVFQRTDGLVVLHHLHGGHGVGRNIACSLVVLVAQQVLPLDVKLVDRSALVAYRAVVGHLNARHFLQHIFYIAVFLALECRHVIIYRVLMDVYRTGLHCHFLQHYTRWRQPYAHSLACVSCADALLVVAHQGELHRLRPVGKGQGECPSAVGQGVGHKRIALAQRLAGNVAHALARLGIGDAPRNLPPRRLREGGKGEKEKQQ